MTGDPLLHAHRQVKRLLPDQSTDGVDMLRRAADAAQERISGELGIAVAAVLLTAWEQRRASGLNGVLGLPNATLALALAVLTLPEEAA